MADEWIEVNLTLPSSDDRVAVLLGVVDPLVHDRLSGRVQSWHFGQYGGGPQPSELRLRVLWSEPARAAEGENILRAFLDDKKQDSSIVDWYPGEHGTRGGTYRGEAGEYGAEMWEATYKLWESQSEFALALFKNEAQGSLSEPLPYHWERVVHLFSNRLMLGLADEVYLSLAQASGYIPYFAGSSGNTAIQQIQAIQVSIGTAPTLQSSLAKSVKEKFKRDFRQP